MGIYSVTIYFVIIAMLLVVGACQCGKSTALTCASQMVGLKIFGTGKSKFCSAFQKGWLARITCRKLLIVIQVGLVGLRKTVQE